MQDEKKLDLVLERFYNRYNKFNTKVLKTLGEAIKGFDGLTPSEAHKLAQELKYSTNIDGLFNELSKISGKSVQDIDKLLDRVAKENVEFGETYYEVKGKEYIPYEENDRLRRYVETIKNETNGTFKNLSRTNSIGFTVKEGNETIFKPLRNAYMDLIDEAVFNVSTGVSDYQSAMRNTIRQLADSGVKVHEAKITSKAGYNRRIDSSVRQAVLTGIRSVNIGIQEEIGKELGTDGVEISHHENCAPDHYEIDGQQFTNEEFEKINAYLDRPVGTLNCRHFIFPIVLGVSLPNYTKQQLERDRLENEKGFEYEGKHYTNYEGSQLMRKIEVSVRKNKDLQIIARASGDKEMIRKSQHNISILMNKYNEISKISGLDTYKNRISVSGYRKVKA